jgi:hypothetical protein
MQTTQEETLKALLYIQRRLKEIKPGTGNSTPIIAEVIGYIDGFTGFVAYPETKREFVPTNFSKETK